MGKKKLYFILSKKGGVGKSMFTYDLSLLLSQKPEFKKTAFFDADYLRPDSSCMRLLKNIVQDKHQLLPLTFTDESGKFMPESIEDFLELFGGSEKKTISVVDMGGGTSENLVRYLKDPDNLAAIKDIIEYFQIEPTFFCLFSGLQKEDTIADIVDTFRAVEPLSAKKVIVNNKYLSVNEDLEDQLITALCEEFEAHRVDFQFVSKSTSTSVINNLVKLINQGVNILQKTVPAFPVDEQMPLRERISLEEANRLIDEFWNRRIAIKSKVDLNFTSFKKQMENIL